MKRASLFLALLLGVSATTLQSQDAEPAPAPALAPPAPIAPVQRAATLEMLKAIKADAELRHLPVLMVTAEARKEDIVLAAQSGAAGYIVKPFSKATLEDKVQRILQKMAVTA